MKRIRIFFNGNTIHESSIPDVEGLIDAWRDSTDRIYTIIDSTTRKKTVFNLDKINVIEVI